MIPEAERNDVIKAYYTRLTSKDDKVRAEAARAWSRWEMATSRTEIDKDYLDRAEDAEFADRFARIEVGRNFARKPSMPLTITPSFGLPGSLLCQRRLDARWSTPREGVDRQDPAHS